MRELLSIGGVRVVVGIDGLDGETQGSGDILHTYPMRRWEWAILVPAAMCGLVGLVLLFAWLIGGWRQWLEAWALLLLSFGFIAVTAIVSRWLAWRVAMHNNAWVMLTEEGIFVRDWRGRKTGLSWEEVRAMYWRFGVRTAPGPTIHVEGRTRALHIPALPLGGIAASLIVRHIAARAGLQCVRTSGYDLGARYEA